MQTALFSQQTIETLPFATELLADEQVAAGQFTREPHVEEDGVDWCAWWAEYAEALE